MTKKILIISFLFSFLVPLQANAIGIPAVVNVLRQMYNLNVESLDVENKQLGGINKLQQSFTGRHNYGSRYYDQDAYLWDNSSDSWEQISSLSRHGAGRGELGETILALAKQYPVQSNFNTPNDTERSYYRLQAQSALASRSAAEVSYKQAVREEKRMRQLHDLIDQVEDEKSASDLNNRIATEQAMTSLQQTKLLSILVQQQAISAQERANRAKEDMDFFDVK